MCPAAQTESISPPLQSRQQQYHANTYSQLQKLPSSSLGAGSVTEVVVVTQKLL